MSGIGDSLLATARQRIQLAVERGMPALPELWPEWNTAFAATCSYDERIDAARALWVNELITAEEHEAIWVEATYFNRERQAQGPANVNEQQEQGSPPAMPE